jgi:hypothetical protein
MPGRIFGTRRPRAAIDATASSSSLRPIAPATPTPILAINFRKSTAGYGRRGGLEGARDDAAHQTVAFDWVAHRRVSTPTNNPAAMQLRRTPVNATTKTSRSALAARDFTRSGRRAVMARARTRHPAWLAQRMSATNSATPATSNTAMTLVGMVCCSTTSPLVGQRRDHDPWERAPLGPARGWAGSSS